MRKENGEERGVEKERHRGETGILFLIFLLSFTLCLVSSLLHVLSPYILFTVIIGGYSLGFLLFFIL